MNRNLSEIMDIWASKKITTSPHKKSKKKGQKLTEHQKKENQTFSSKIIFVEHSIRVLKIFKVDREKFRLRRHKYQQVISVVCGLVRLRIGALILSSYKSIIISLLKEFNNVIFSVNSFR